jgi:hypothetical protein
MPDPETPRTAQGAAEAELIAFMDAWDRAMVANDADAIGPYMADDWAIVGPDGRVGDKARFLELVRSGDLTHDAMRNPRSEHLVLWRHRERDRARRVGAPFIERSLFHLVERSSCVFVRGSSLVVRVLTHLSQLPRAPGPDHNDPRGRPRALLPRHDRGTHRSAPSVALDRDLSTPGLPRRSRTRSKSSLARTTVGTTSADDPVRSRVAPFGTSGDRRL